MAAIGFMLAAGAGVALYDYLSNKGQQLSITDNITTDMSINVNFTSNTSCSSVVSGQQAITIEPGTNTNVYNPALLNAENGACTVCVNTMNALVDLRLKLEQDAVVASRGRYTAQTASEPVQIAMTGGTNLGDNAIGACTLMCNDVVVYGVQQSQSFTAQTNCEVDTSVKNNLSQGISGKITASLKNQQDILGQIESAFTSNQESITNNLATVMNQTINTTVQQQLANNAESTQNFTVGLSDNNGQDETHSIFVNGLTQSFTANSIANLLVNNQVNNTLRQSADYSIAQTLLNKNDTIGDITKDFTNVITSMGEFLDTIVGDMLILVASMIGIFIIIVGSLYFFTTRGRQLGDSLVNVGEQKARTKIDNLAKTDTLAKK